MSPATIVRVRWLRCGAGGLVDGRCAAAAARRERADRLLHAADLWRNRAIRENCTMLLLFKINQDAQIKKLFSEADLDMTEQEFVDMCKEVHSVDS